MIVVCIFCMCFEVLYAKYCRSWIQCRKAVVKINISGFLAIALAMERRCFWPPDTLVPPCEIGESYVSGFASINSVAWATSAASFTSSTEMSVLNRNEYWNRSYLRKEFPSAVHIQALIWHLSVSYHGHQLRLQGYVPSSHRRIAESD